MVLYRTGFRELKRTIAGDREDREPGLHAFRELNGGTGWMLPVNVSFAVREDGAVDFDAPGGPPREVRSRIGDRFLKETEKDIPCRLIFIRVPYDLIPREPCPNPDTLSNNAGNGTGM